MEKESILFTPGKIGPLTLRNRTIRAAAFESMCPGNAPSDMLYDYHKSVAAGGIGMTTLAYAAVTQSGLSFERQLWMRPDIIPGLKRITDAIHKEGAGRLRTTRTLRKHVPQKHLRMQAYFRIRRFQHLFPHSCTGNETFRNHGYGKSIRTSGPPGTRSRDGCCGNTCRPRLSDQPVPFTLYQPPKRRIWR